MNTVASESDADIQRVLMGINPDSDTDLVYSVVDANTQSTVKGQ